MAEEQQFLGYILLRYTILNFSIYIFISSPLDFSDPLSRRIFFPIYSCWDCIQAFYLDGPWSLLRYLSYHCFANGSRISCRLWRHCSGAIKPLCGKLSWYNALNWEVIGALSKSSSFSCLHAATSFLGLQLYGLGDLSPVSRGVSTPRAPWLNCLPQFHWLD